jgi:magnesium-transporting ATPase (P-type)
VPGDVVLMEVGNRVPADVRFFVAATLEIEEAALIGESLPVAKDTGLVPGRRYRWVWHCPSSRVRDRRVRGRWRDDGELRRAF